MFVSDVLKKVVSQKCTLMINMKYYPVNQLYTTTITNVVNILFGRKGKGTLLVETDNGGKGKGRLWWKRATPFLAQYYNKNKRIT